MLKPPLSGLLKLAFICLLSALTAGCGTGNRSTYDLSGRVTGTFGGLPVPNAQVSVGNRFSTTDSDGYYSISSITAWAELKMTVTATGYQAYSATVSGSKDENKVVNVVLLPGDGSGSTSIVVGVRLANSSGVDLTSKTFTRPTTTMSVPTLTTLSTDEYVSGRLIVESSDEATLFEALAGISSAKAESVPGSQTYLITVDASRIDEVIQLLTNLNGVLRAERDRVVRAHGIIPNDPYYANQWYLPLISLPDAWEQSRGSAGITVAVIDSGVDIDHPDIDPDIFVSGHNFSGDQAAENDFNDLNGHGTHVTGIIAATTNNSVGVSGVTWGVRIMPLRVLDQSGNGSSLRVAQAIDWAAANGADVINLSLGQESDAPCDEYLGESIQDARSQGVILVASAGNNGGPVTCPANHPDTIAVGAVDYLKQVASYSNFGPSLDLVAPGGSAENPILNTIINSYGYLSGTSMAAPQVAGVIALMLSAGIDPDAVRSLLHQTAEDLGPLGHDAFYGYGLLNSVAAILRARVSQARVALFNDHGELLSTVAAVGSESRMAIVESASLAENPWVIGWLDSDEDGLIGSTDYTGAERVESIAAGRDLVLSMHAQLPIAEQYLVTSLLTETSPTK